MKRIGLLAISLVVIGLTTSQVIAAEDTDGTDSLVNESAESMTTLGNVSITDILVIAVACVVVFLFVTQQWYRLDKAPGRPAAFTPFVGWMIALSIIFLGLVGAGLARQAVGIDGKIETLTEHAQVGLGAYVAQGIGVAVYFWLRAESRAPVPDRRHSQIYAGVTGVVALICAMPLMATASALIIWVLQSQVGLIAHDTLQMLTESPKDVWFAVVAGQVVLAAPIIEEVLYRGLIQQSLIQWGVSRWGAIIATSAGFAMMHWGAVEIHAVVALFVLSIALGWAYEKTGRLTAPIVMHVVFNAGNLAIGLAAT